MNNNYKYRRKREYSTPQNDVVGQNLVGQKYPRISFRLDVEFNEKVRRWAKVKDKTPSEFTRIVLEHYIKKLEEKEKQEQEKEWQKEVSEWNNKPKLKLVS